MRVYNYFNMRRLTKRVIERGEDTVEVEPPADFGVGPLSAAASGPGDRSFLSPHLVPPSPATCLLRPQGRRPGSGPTSFPAFPGRAQAPGPVPGEDGRGVAQDPSVPPQRPATATPGHAQSPFFRKRKGADGGVHGGQRTSGPHAGRRRGPCSARPQAAPGRPPPRGPQR